MSSGDFVNAVYETDAGFGTFIRLQPETLQATNGTTANAESAIALTDGFPTIKASCGRREFGVCPRRAVIEWDTRPTGYTGDTAEIIIPDPATFAAWSRGDTITYATGSGTLRFLSPEVVR